MANRKRKATSEIRTYQYDNLNAVRRPTDEGSESLGEEMKKPQLYRPTLRATEENEPRLSWARGWEPNIAPVAKASPLYVVARIHPRQWINELLRDPDQLDIFADEDENRGAGDDTRPYEYSEGWTNRLVKGQSADVMASLLVHEGMRGQVKMIYYDPPYGVGYKSNFQPSTNSRDIASDSTAIPNDVTPITAFRDTWEREEHSYLDTILRNVGLAWQLLREDGSIFFQISSDNLLRVGLVLDEVFGSHNRVSIIPFKKTGGSRSKSLPEVCDYLLHYAKNKELLLDGAFHHLYERGTRQELLKGMATYARVKLADGKIRKLCPKEKDNLNLLPKGSELVCLTPLVSQSSGKGARRDRWKFEGKVYQPGAGESWRTTVDGLDKLANMKRIRAEPSAKMPRWIKHESEIPGKRLGNMWSTMMPPKNMHYACETSPKVIQRCMLMCTEPGDLVLDITCGSGTTPFVAESWGRRWIAVDSSAVSIAITHQRLATATYDYHMIKTSEHGAIEECALGGTVDSRANPESPTSGFVYERFRPVTTKTLVENDEVDTIFLVDQPKRLPRTIRCTSAYTMETQSPFRYIDSETPPEDILAHNRQVRDRIISALSVSGIASPENGTEGDRWAVTDLQVRRGDDSQTKRLVTHTASIRDISTGMDAESELTSVAVTVAPDDVTVTKEYIDRALRETKKLRIRDVDVQTLIVIGFSFDTNATGPRLTKKNGHQIMLVQANRDLMIEELRNIEHDNAFILLAEPNIIVRQNTDGTVQVEVDGFFSFNPRTGSVNKGMESEIQMWMVDRDYDGLAFRCHEIHFLNHKDDQVKRLEKALQNQLDDGAWKLMTSRTSHRFKPGEYQRAAIRMITCGGTEITGVVDLQGDRKS